MRFVESSSVIEASPEAVWKVLSDGGSWPAWDSGVESVDGEFAPGETITIRSAVAPGRAFPVQVKEFQPPGRLCLSGGMPLGLFRGVRTYDLTSGPDGTTSFRLREEYTGPLVGLIWRTMPDLQPSFDTFAQGLKARVESGS
jgi:hypothetical protein